MNKNNNEKIVFQKDIIKKQPEYEASPWKILVADDEEVIHALTRLVLKDYVFENRSIQILSAYSGREAIDILSRENDIALVLLDVVMETDDAGLKCARDIRENLRNSAVRIILRTGQPGQAPEKEIIVNYEINDYKAKSELTSQKLFTVITTSLRDYKHIDTITRNKKGLETVINASSRLFELHSFNQFASGILQQMTSILGLDEDSLYIIYSSLSAIQEYRKNDYTIQAATGIYSGKENCSIADVIPEKIYLQLMKAVEQHKSIFTPTSYIGYYESHKGEKNLLLLQWKRKITETDRNLISIFSTNVAAAFENISMNNELSATQKEIIFTFSEVVEGRSKETVEHIRRVTETACLLGEKLGLSKADIETLRLTAPMHDIGKVGIPDSVLNKPSRLTPEEYQIVKKHAEIGYNIFRKSSLGTMAAAAIVAHQHHEKWNGTGYPQGLRGEEIHIFGRITAFVDVVDALANQRCYKKAWPIDEVIREVKKERGEHFDPAVVDAFLDSIEAYKKLL